MTDVDGAAAPGGSPERRRPQFGEYATPEEQRAAIAVPADIASSEPVPIAADAPTPPPASSPSPASAAAGTVAARPPVDRFVSWALLGLGLFNILTTIPALIDLPGAITQFFSSDDVGPYGPVGTARALGIAGLVVSVAAWAGALLLVQRRVAAGRSSWWIPLIAGVVANVVVLVCVGAAMMIDPEVFGYIQRMSGTAP